MLTTKGKFVLLLFFTLCLGPNVIDYIGIAQNNYYTILLIVSFVFAYGYRRFVDKHIIYLIVFTIFYGVFKICTDTGEGTRAIVLCALAPGVLFSAYPPIKKNSLSNIRIWRALALLLLVFYLVETGVAIYERLTWKLVFGWAETHSVGIDVTAIEFRSTALLGHPLANALIVSTIMAFFLVSPIKSKYKYSLWFWGLLAVMCFNARGAIIGNVAVLGLYLFYTFLFDKRLSYKKKCRLFFLVLLLSGAGLYLFVSGYVGGRLMESGVNDGSSQVRIDIWSVFTKYDVGSFLIGVNSHDLDMIMYSLGLYATENYWLDWIFRLGVFFLVPYVFLYAGVLKHEYSGYSKVDFLITFVAFLGISSTNNSLSSSILPTFVFLLCIRVFKKETFSYIIPTKYLDRNRIV